MYVSEFIMKHSKYNNYDLTEEFLSVSAVSPSPYLTWHPQTDSSSCPHLLPLGITYLTCHNAVIYTFVPQRMTVVCTLFVDTEIIFLKD
jgi:hypothetical protein